LSAVGRSGLQVQQLPAAGSSCQTQAQRIQQQCMSAQGPLQWLRPQAAGVQFKRHNAAARWK
jgi:hypothetical protein